VSLELAVGHKIGTQGFRCASPAISSLLLLVSGFPPTFS